MSIHKQIIIFIYKRYPKSQCRFWVWWVPTLFELFTWEKSICEFREEKIGLNYQKLCIILTGINMQFSHRYFQGWRWSRIVDIGKKIDYLHVKSVKNVNSKYYIVFKKLAHFAVYQPVNNPLFFMQIKLQ